MTANKSMLVTNHGEFYRAQSGDETRYFAVSKKAAAQAFDHLSDPPIVMGFAVYDSTVSTIYAVALYATLAEAEAHEASPAPMAPASVFPAAETTPEPEPEPTPTATFGSKRKRRF